MPQLRPSHRAFPKQSNLEEEKYGVNKKIRFSWRDSPAKMTNLLLYALEGFESKSISVHIPSVIKKTLRM
jgi:hypothetical protein